MPAVSPLTKEKAAPEVKPIYDKLSGVFGHMPNIFAVMAHRPSALKSLLDLYGAVINEGTLEPKYKELAYLETSIVNACEY